MCRSPGLAFPVENRMALQSNPAMRWQSRIHFVVSLLLVLVCFGIVLQSQEKTARDLYAAERQKTREAFKQKDDKGLRDALLQLQKDFPGRSAIPEELAGVEARLGNTGQALEWLKASVAMGLIPKLDDTSFDVLRKAGKLDDIVRQNEQNRTSVSFSKSVFRIEPADLIIEDIAYDKEARRFLLSSVHQRKIITCGQDGQCADFITSADSAFQPLWGVLALRVDPSGKYLWATTESLPFEISHNKAEEGRCALLQINLKTRALIHRYDCDSGGQHEMGDMTIASNGDVYVSDGGSGDLFVLRHDHDRLEKLVPSGTFVSPQTPALSSDEKLLYVPDYVAGIAAISLTDHSIRWLTSTSPAALDGIDGLYTTKNGLIGIQNGTAPERVVEFRLETPVKVASWTVLEANWIGLGDPTHGVIVGDDFYFIANSGWDRVDQNGNIAPGKGAEIRKMPLSH